ncbi:MAG TPA: hypothetical protein VGD65_24340 [Chryseosolibacter sp.]
MKLGSKLILVQLLPISVITSVEGDGVIADAKRSSHGDGSMAELKSVVSESK